MALIAMASAPAFECHREAYNRFPAELAPYYECRLQVIQRHDTCIRATLGACPLDVVDVTACNDSLGTGIRACPPPSDIPAASALAACLSG